jgi:hypothetical protein
MSLIYHHTPFQDRNIIGASGAHASSSFLCQVTVIGCKEMRSMSSDILQRHDIHTYIHIGFVYQKKTCHMTTDYETSLKSTIHNTLHKTSIVQIHNKQTVQIQLQQYQRQNTNKRIRKRYKL